MTRLNVITTALALTIIAYFILDGVHASIRKSEIKQCQEFKTPARPSWCDELLNDAGGAQ